MAISLSKLTHVPRWTQVRDLLFPPDCVACGRPGERLCATCHGRIAFIVPPVCQRCGMPNPAAPATCRHCTASLAHIKHLRSAAWHTDPLVPFIHQFKYNGEQALIHELGPLLTAAWQPPLPTRSVLLVPVPLSNERRNQRGYNQASLLARFLADHHKQDLVEHNLMRTRETPPQVGLSLAERKTNVAGAFSVSNPAVFRQRSILLVDDVCTTGSTLDACAQPLLAAGAVAVYALTLSRAVPGRITPAVTPAP